MVASTISFPAKIEPDAIVEAVFEIRFDSVAPLPEILFGRLAELPQWKAFAQRRLPTYDIPAAFREADMNLRYAAVFELVGASQLFVRLGTHVLSFHCRAPYVGWDTFNSELAIAIDGLFASAQGLVVRRLGMRYINAFTTALHGIAGITDLNCEIQVSQRRLTNNLNLNFTTDQDERTKCTVRIGTIPEFGMAPAIPDATVIVDVEVFTPPNFSVNAPQDVKVWASVGRVVKNAAFFGLLNPTATARLRRDS